MSQSTRGIQLYMAGQEYQPKQNEPIIVERIGVRQHIIMEDISDFDICTVIRSPPLPKLYAVITNNDLFYLFEETFASKHQNTQNDTHLVQYCLLRIDLRITYKLQALLHTKIRYSTNFDCFFMILGSGELAVFSYEMDLLTKVKLECQKKGNNMKHCLDFDYFEKDPFSSSRKLKTGFFVFLFSESLEIHELEINSNHRLSKFKQSYKCNVTQINKRQIQQGVKHPYKLFFFTDIKKGQMSKKIINDKSYLACNCNVSVCFYQMNKQWEVEDIIQLKGLCPASERIQCIQILFDTKRTILGFSNGSVKIYSLKQENRAKLLFTIKITDSSVYQFYFDDKIQRLITYSKDLVFSLVNLQNMSIEQQFRSGSFSQGIFLNRHTFIGLGSILRNIYSLTNRTQSSFTKCLIYNSLDFSCRKVTELNSHIICSYHWSDTHLLQLNDSLLFAYFCQDKPPYLLSTYLPPKCTSINSVIRNIHIPYQQYWLLTDRSQIYKYIIKEEVNEDKAVRVSEVQTLQTFIDKFGGQYKYKVSCLMMGRKIVPLWYDSQNTENEYPPNLVSYEQFHPLYLGTNTGQFLAVSMYQPSRIVLRIKSIQACLSFILEITLLRGDTQNKGIIIYGSYSIGKATILEVSSNQIPVQLFRLDLGSAKIQQLNSNFFTIINGYHFNLFYFVQEQEKIECYKVEHYCPGLAGQPNVTCISYNQEHGEQFVVVGYSLGQIIIWKIEKQITQNNIFNLIPYYLLENSKEEIIQNVILNNSIVYFNLGTLLVSKQLNNKLSNLQHIQFLKTSNPPIKMQKYGGMNQFNLNIKKSHQLQYNLKSQRKRKQSQLQLPQIKKKGKKRSESVGMLLRDRKKLQAMFHLPDLQFYRSLINNNINR